MEQKDWQGVFPAITTPFTRNLAIDYDALSNHVSWLVDCGCRGIVALGSLGEGATLSFAEKIDIVSACKQALGSRAPVIAGISSLSTAEAVALAEAAARANCDGLMILPPYVYRGDWRETKAHLSAALAATSLSCILYNNPIAYGTDLVPAQIEELAQEHPNLHAVKESSGDVRRVTAIRELLGDRLAIFAGLDDAILESIAVGAVGWVAGLVNALPRESVHLFDLAMTGQCEKAQELYQWFLPLLRLDTLPKFVQLIKLVQREVGRGSTAVRSPRLELEGEELDQAVGLILRQLGRRSLVSNGGN
jgi:dihydrodipicolinate synthase/N-acetylneuraminate lyase